MKSGIQNTGLKLAAVFMILTLAWLTVSIPFVFQQQQELSSEIRTCDCGFGDNEIPNPFANTTEEKTESGVNTLTEYLHDYPVHSAAENFILKHNRHHIADVYVAFHGELLSPPPKA